ncbi:hypothetical protein DFH06DRAFT_1134156 [Mycena polygramma]|nr:hypothetical protein DFH06DRAFT_1134156 [Mycena polygramma]
MQRAITCVSLLNIPVVLLDLDRVSETVNIGVGLAYSTLEIDYLPSFAHTREFPLLQASRAQHVVQYFHSPYLQILSGFGNICLRPWGTNPIIFVFWFWIFNRIFTLLLPMQWASTPRPHESSTLLSRFASNPTSPPPGAFRNIYEARCEISSDETACEPLRIVNNWNCLLIPSMTRHRQQTPILAYYLLDDTTDKSFPLGNHRILRYAFKDHPGPILPEYGSTVIRENSYYRVASAFIAWLMGPVYTPRPAAPAARLRVHKCHSAHDALSFFLSSRTLPPPLRQYPSILSALAAGTFFGAQGMVAGGIPHAVVGAWQASAGGRARAAAMGLRSGAVGLGLPFGAMGVAAALFDGAVDVAGVDPTSDAAYWARTLSSLPVGGIGIYAVHKIPNRPPMAPMTVAASAILASILLGFTTAAAKHRLRSFPSEEVSNTE